MGAIHRQTGERDWDGVEAVAYDYPAVAGVEKRELIGPADGAPHYRLRHFHVPAGARTARESHPHDHGVVIVSGRASVTRAWPETITTPWSCGCDSRRVRPPVGTWKWRTR